MRGTSMYTKKGVVIGVNLGVWYKLNPFFFHKLHLKKNLMRSFLKKNEEIAT